MGQRNRVPGKLPKRARRPKAVHVMSEALGVGYFFKRILIDSSAHPAILYLTPVNAALLSSPPKPLELPRVGFAEKPPTALSCASPHTIDCVYLHTYRATAVLGRPMQSKDV